MPKPPLRPGSRSKTALRPTRQPWATLFELYDLLSNRSDIKNELLQELERQRQQLAKFEGFRMSPTIGFKRSLARSAPSSLPWATFDFASART